MKLNFIGQGSRNYTEDILLRGIILGITRTLIEEKGRFSIFDIMSLICDDMEAGLMRIVTPTYVQVLVEDIWYGITILDRKIKPNGDVEYIKRRG